MIYVTTGSIRKPKIGEVLQTLAGGGIHHIELSSGTDFYPEFESDVLSLKEKYGLNYFLHNYCPPPQKHFVLNLATTDPNALKRNRHFCMEAINLAERVGSAYYGVHAGFCVEAKPDDLGHDLTKLANLPMDVAEKIFIESIQLLADHARPKGIQVLIENNVLAPFNLKNGKNSIFLGVTGTDLVRIFQGVNRTNVGLLLDYAHMHVSATALGFSEEEMVDQVKSHIKYLHLSHNDGQKDSNQPLQKNSWLWPKLRSVYKKDMAVVLEVYNISPEEIRGQFELITNKLQ